LRWIKAVCGLDPPHEGIRDLLRFSRKARLNEHADLTFARASAAVVADGLTSSEAEARLRKFGANATSGFERANSEELGTAHRLLVPSSPAETAKRRTTTAGVFRGAW
jgi:hypothetical protein